MKMYAIIIAIAAVSVLGDYFLKLASLEPRPIVSRWFIAGCGIYVISAFGWVFVMQHAKLAIIGAVFSVAIVLLLAIVGLAAFGEKLDHYEVAGVSCAVVAIILLGRFTA